MKYASFREIPIPNGFFDGLNYKIGFHVVCHGVSQDDTADNVLDGTEILKSFTGPDVADVASDDLERLGDVKIANSVDISVSAGLTAIRQRTLPSAPVNGDKAQFLHNLLNTLIRYFKSLST